MTDKYILDGKKAVPADLMTWAKWYETAHRHVAKTEKDDVLVSTVFLGMNHAYGPNEPPKLFETMIFGGPHTDYQERCSTWEQAEAMHTEACKLAGLESPFTAS